MKSARARNSFAQIDIYRNVVPDGNIKLEHNEAKNNKNKIEVVFSGLFLFYKTFFSSQDLTVCTFSPSCSEFGILAVKKFGVIKGGVMTMDRLTRCNGLSPSNYEIDKKTMLLKDDPGYIYRVPVVSSLK
ncbi:MAG: membrane protein insertion efficiency factor YidD [Cytophagaceae bacterium]|nr:membrane protein insertion efficiency factor YidD [Cytophagaceae bacterium]